MQSAARTYFQTQVTTTTQGDLLIMLFDAALKFLRQAKEKIAEKNYAQKGILISKALDILSELQGSLNAQKGGDLADRLQKLYFFCSTRLLAANLKLDVTKIDEVMHILEGLRDAFNEANGQVATKVVPASPTPSAHRVMPVASAQAQASAPTAQALYLAQSATVAAAPAPAAAPAQQHPADLPPVADAPDTLTAAAALEDVAASPLAHAAPVRRIMAAYAAGRVQG
jgi:flagellar protein FliS